MKQKWLLFLVPALACALVGLLAYQAYQRNLAEKNRQVSCLAFAIPKVVLHNQQQEIVSLLSQLAKETEVPVVEKTESETFIFSKAVDSELLKLSELFQMKSRSLPFDEAQVSSVVDRALGLMANLPNPFLHRCEALMLEAETKCGDLNTKATGTSPCLEPYNSRLEKLL